MNYEHYFKDMFIPIPDYRKRVLKLFIIKKDSKFLQECGFLTSGINSLNEDFENILTEQNEEDSSFVKNEEEALIERYLEFLKRQLFL